MFLTRLVRATKREDGVAMAAVLGMMAVGLLITSLVLTSVVSASGFSTYTRAGVQSQAAAEAGIAAARAGLVAGTCASKGTPPTYRSDSGTTPTFVATIWRPGPSGGWVQGCPVGTATQVRILSTGYASSDGAGSISAGDETVLEAILSSLSAPITITASGPAVYSYGNGSLGNGASLISTDGAEPDIQVKKGNYICDGKGLGSADLVVEGSVTVNASCEISGDVFATGEISFAGSGKVTGNVISNTGVKFYNGSIGGRLWTSGPFDMSQGNATIQGIFKAGSFRFVGGTTNGNGYVYGLTNLSGVWGNLNKPIATQSVSGAPDWWWNANKSKFTVATPVLPTYVSDLPAMPVIPNWVDFGSQPAHYTTDWWQGFTLYTMGTSCGAVQVKAAVAALSAKPGLIDARNCVGGVVLDGNHNVVLANDLVIFAKSFTISGSGRFSSSAGARLWLINPDTTANNLPDCAGQKMSISGGDTPLEGLKTFIYTPCKADVLSAIRMTGQIIAGETALAGGVKLTYAAIGLPGINLDTGASSGSTPSESDRQLLSLRNVEG